MKCEACNGRGVWEVGADYYSLAEDCPMCDGTGQAPDEDLGNGGSYE